MQVLLAVHALPRHLRRYRRRVSIDGRRVRRRQDIYETARSRHRTSTHRFCARWCGLPISSARAVPQMGLGMVDAVCGLHHRRRHDPRDAMLHPLRKALPNSPSHATRCSFTAIYGPRCFYPETPRRKRDHQLRRLRRPRLSHSSQRPSSFSNSSSSAFQASFPHWQTGPGILLTRDITS